MITRSTISVVAAALCGVSVPSQGQQKASAPAPNWASVEDALGRKGAMQPGDVIKFAFPRSDLTVTIGGVTLKPALALGGWTAFKETGRVRQWSWAISSSPKMKSVLL